MIVTLLACCLRYCKSTIFQANHNRQTPTSSRRWVVCDTAKVRFFKQITTRPYREILWYGLFAILQKYDFSSKSQQYQPKSAFWKVVCDTAKVRFFKQITTRRRLGQYTNMLFAILQKYDFSSKSQPAALRRLDVLCCLRYCKSTIFQANHNASVGLWSKSAVVCDTAKVRFFKQITTR